MSTFNETTTSIIDNLKPLADGKIIVPLKNYIHNLTLDVISKVSFSYFIMWLLSNYLFIILLFIGCIWI